MSEIASRLLSDVSVVVGLYLILRIVGKAGFRRADLVPWVIGGCAVLVFILATPEQILDWMQSRGVPVSTFLLWLIIHLPSIAMFGFLAWLAFTKWPISERTTDVERSTATPTS